MLESVARTERWLLRCKNELNRLNSLPDTINKEQLLFGINQGGVYSDIRIENAKRILRGYLRWRRVANDIDGQKVTTTYSFMPRSQSFSRNSQVEKLAIRKVDAELELDAIEQAVSGLHDPLYRRILYEKYLQWDCKKDETISMDLAISESSYYDILDKALIAFAELYRNGEQIEILE